MPGRNAKSIKTMYCIKRKDEEEKASCSLPWDDLLPRILAFVGDGHYRFVGSVNHTFHDAYLALFPSKETKMSVSSNALAELCMKDCAEKWDAFSRTPVSLKEDEDRSKLDGSYAAIRLLIAAARYNFEVLQHLHTLSFHPNFMEEVWSSHYISACAAKEGNLQVVQWLREQDLSCGRVTCTGTWAAGGGQLEVLQWCHTHGFEWNEDTFFEAVESRNLPVLEYLHENGCPWSSLMCAMAAEMGDLEILQWLRSKGCPWCPETPSTAAYHGHLHVLKWAYDNDCPVDYQTCISAYQGKQWEIWDWALEHDLPLCPAFFSWRTSEYEDYEEVREMAFRLRRRRRLLR